MNSFYWSVCVLGMMAKGSFALPRMLLQQHKGALELVGGTFAAAQVHEPVAAAWDPGALIDFVNRLLSIEDKFIARDQENELIGFVRDLGGVAPGNRFRELRQELSRQGWVKDLKTIDGATLSEADYQAVAALCNDTAMTLFVNALLKSEDRFVPDEDRDQLAGFVSWFSGTQATQSLDQMNTELFVQPWVHSLRAVVVAADAPAVVPGRIVFQSVRAAEDESHKQFEQAEVRVKSDKARSDGMTGEEIQEAVHNAPKGVKNRESKETMEHAPKVRVDDTAEDAVQNHPKGAADEETRQAVESAQNRMADISSDTLLEGYEQRTADEKRVKTLVAAPKGRVDDKAEDAMENDPKGVANEETTQVVENGPKGMAKFVEGDEQRTADEKGEETLEAAPKGMTGGGNKRKVEVAPRVMVIVDGEHAVGDAPKVMVEEESEKPVEDAPHQRCPACIIWGDASILSFNGYLRRAQAHPKRAIELWVRRDTTDQFSISEAGTYWLLKSDEVQMQGRYWRYNPTKPGVGLGSIIIGGPMVGNNSLVIRSLNGNVMWNEHEILNRARSNFSNEFVQANSMRVVGQVAGDDDAPGIKFKFANGVHLTVARYAQHLSARIKLCDSLTDPAPIAGQCGN